MSKAVITIGSRADLALLNPYQRNRSRPKFRQIKLDVPGLSQPELAAREQRLNRIFFDCGCAEATGFGLAALLGALAWITLRPEGWSGASWWDLAYAAAAFFIATGIGKGVGRLRARYALRREIAGLGHYFKDAESPESRLGVRCARL